jgi:hypothetical protein
MFNIPAWSRISNPYHYANRGRSSLLITVGESWTYGDSIGQTKVREGRDDTEYRLEHIYGNIISDAMQSDWINLALPGGSNYLMLSWLRDLLKQDFKYDTITCIITLTESGRHEDRVWFDNSLTELQAVLNTMVLRTYDAIDQLQIDYPGIKFISAHNFTDSADSRPIEKTWIEVMTRQSVQNDTFILISDYIGYLNHDKKFSDVLDVIDRASARLDILDQCEYCNREDSRHPTEQGHAMWAEYLINYL